MINNVLFTKKNLCFFVVCNDVLKLNVLNPFKDVNILNKYDNPYIVKKSPKE
jgi:hypothetical protein